MRASSWKACETGCRAESALIRTVVILHSETEDKQFLE